MGNKKVSVPSRGARYLNDMYDPVINLLEECFRPLSGSKVSEPNLKDFCIKNASFRPLSGSKVSERKTI